MTTATDNLSTEFPTSIISGKTTGWRTRAKLAVRGSLTSPQIGLFKVGTHDIEDQTKSEDHHPKINELLIYLKKLLPQFQIEPYDEKTLSGDLRYVQCALERKTEKVQLTLVANGRANLKPLIDHLWETHPLHSIWVNIQEGSTNTILGPTWIHHYGPEATVEELALHKSYFHPACFAQANLDLYEVILSDIRAALLSNKEILELFAGVGTISLACKDKCKASTLVEINPFAKPCYLKGNPPSHFQFVTASADDHPIEQEVLIVDPPRKGLSRKILEKIIHSDLKQIIYLSCNFNTLKKDIQFLEAHGWGIDLAKVYDLFPNTAHREVLAVLKKSG